MSFRGPLCLAAIAVCMLPAIGCRSSGERIPEETCPDQQGNCKDVRSEFENEKVVELPAESELAGEFYVISVGGAVSDWPQMLGQCLVPLARRTTLLKAGEALAYVGWDGLDLKGAQTLYAIPCLAQVELHRKATRDAAAMQALLSATFLRRVLLTLPHDARHLLSAIRKSSSVESVVIHEADNVLQDSDVEQLSTMSTLRHLALIQCWGVTGTFLQKFRRGTLMSLEVTQLGPDTNTEEFFLSNNLLDEGARLQLEELVLRHCAFEQPISLATVFQIRSLKRLILDRPVEQLLVDKRVEYPASLEGLALVYCGLLPTDLAAMSPLPLSLRRLDLSWNKLGDDVAVDCLLTARALEHVDLSGMRLSLQLVKRILQLTQLKTLQCYLTDDVTDDDLKALNDQFPLVTVIDTSSQD